MYCFSSLFSKLCFVSVYFFFFGLFPYLGSVHRLFNLHVLRSCASSIFTPLSFIYFLITSLHLSFRLHIVRCSPTSIFSLIYILRYFSPHGINISVSLLLFSNLCCHTWPCSYFFSTDIINAFIDIIPLDILISVHSGKFCSACLTAQVSFPQSRTGPMTVFTYS